LKKMSIKDIITKVNRYLKMWWWNKAIKVCRMCNIWSWHKRLSYHCFFNGDEALNLWRNVFRDLSTTNLCHLISQIILLVNKNMSVFLLFTIFTPQWSQV
jgi:hypothetical protein